MEARARRPWQQKEDEILWEALKNCGEQDDINWNEIANHLEGRNNKDCRKRWVYTLCPSVNKGSWTEEEDLLLIQGIEMYGPNWPKVSQVVETRQADQCSRRWSESLNPEIYHGKWSVDEDMILQDAVNAHGRKWTEIARTYFQHRTPLSVKNRHSQLHRQRLKQSSGLDTSHKEQNLETTYELETLISLDSSFQNPNLSFPEYSPDPLSDVRNSRENYNSQNLPDSSHQQLLYTTEPIAGLDTHEDWTHTLISSPVETYCNSWTSTNSEMWHFSSHIGLNSEEVLGTQYNDPTNIYEHSIPVFYGLDSVDHDHNSDARDWGATLDIPHFSDFEIHGDGLASDWGTFGNMENLDAMYELPNDVSHTLSNSEERTGCI